MTAFERRSELSLLLDDLRLRPDIAIDFRRPGNGPTEVRCSVSCVRQDPDELHYRFTAVVDGRDFGDAGIREHFTITSRGRFADAEHNDPASLQRLQRLLSALKTWHRSERSISLNPVHAICGVLASRMVNIDPSAQAAAPITETILNGLRQLESLSLCPDEIAKGQLPGQPALLEHWTLRTQRGVLTIARDEVEISIHTTPSSQGLAASVDRFILMAVDALEGARTPVDLRAVQALLNTRRDFSGSIVPGAPIGLALHFSGLSPAAHYALLFAHPRRIS